MTRIFNFIFYVLLLPWIFSGCSSNAQTNNQEWAESISLFADSMEQAGILHNQSLDYTLAALQKEKRRLFKESGIQITQETPSDIKKQFMNVGYDAMKSFFKDLNLSFNDADIEKMINRDHFLSGKINGKEEGEKVIETSTPFVKEYYGKLEKLTNNSRLSLPQLQEKIKRLEQEIKTEASGTAEIKENDVVAGMPPSLYTHPSDSSKYIMVRLDGAVSVEQCDEDYVFDERIRSCTPAHLAPR
jgi:hypothetical protein